jgi:hypothetical protein
MAEEEADRFFDQPALTPALTLTLSRRERGPEILFPEGEGI